MLLKEDDALLVGGGSSLQMGHSADCDTSAAVGLIPHSQFQLLWNRCLSVRLSCSPPPPPFFFSLKLGCLCWNRGCMCESLQSSCFAAPLSLYKTLTWTSRVGKRVPQHPCSRSRVLVLSIKAKAPPPPHFHSPNTNRACLRTSWFSCRWFSRWCHPVDQRQRGLNPVREKKKKSSKVKQCPAQKLKQKKKRKRKCMPEKMCPSQVQWTFHRSAQFNTLMHSVQRKASAYSEMHEHTC